jgi:hypothetical protein
MRTDIVCGLASNPTGGMDQRQPGFLFPQSESMFAKRCSPCADMRSCSGADAFFVVMAGVVFGAWYIWKSKDRLNV